MDGRHGVEFFSGVLIPGMVNAHSHLELSYLLGAIEPLGGFAGFAAGMVRTRNAFTVEQRMAAIAYRDAKMWSDGVAAVADISNDALSLETKRNSRINYHTFFELFGLGTQSAEGVMALQAEATAIGLGSSVTPHSMYSLNEAMFGAAINATPDLALSIHFMESSGESELFAGHGELYEWYKKCGFAIDFAHHLTPTQRIISTISPSRRVMLVHNTLVGPDDVDALMAHFGDNLTMVLCPRSNLYITGQQPPVEMLRRRGVRIAVGTDSLASNQILSMVDELKCFADVPLEELLLWATASGAQAMGLEGQCGVLEVGQKCGVVLLEGVDWPNQKLSEGATSRRLV